MRHAVQPPHPLKAAIINAGYHSVAHFARVTGQDDGNLSRVINRRIEPWPKLRRLCSEELGIPEAELFPDVKVPAS